MQCGIFARMPSSIKSSNVNNRMDRYRALQPQWIALLEGEVNCMANLANLSAAIYTAFDWHWVGFYVVDQHRDELVLAPFQGPVACTRLHHGKGVCAAAWDSKSAQVVDDVESFPGHIACSALSISELVLPVVVEGEVVAVLDIDSTSPADFSQVDVEGFASIIGHLESRWNQWE
jgi:L-methionine (R)-S-oxide reductase